MTTADFKNWYFNKFSWLKLSDNDIKVLKSTDKLILCKKFNYRFSVYELKNENFIERYFQVSKRSSKSF